MPPPTRSSSSLAWTVAGATLLSLLALLGGWWIGRQQAGGKLPEDPRREALLQESARLGQKLIRGEENEGDRQRYLELLVGLGRKDEAIAVLEPMADREPERWALRLMLAELRRDQGDPRGAERELRQILNRQPNQIDALQLLTLLQLEQGQGRAAEIQVKGVYARLIRPNPKPEALGVGLLLAELQQQRKQAMAAELTYKELALAFPQDPRPPIGLALMRYASGNRSGALEALQQARRRSPDLEKPDPRLDALAASWGLEQIRGSAAAPPAQGQGALQPQLVGPSGSPAQPQLLQPPAQPLQPPAGQPLPAQPTGSPGP